MILVSLQTKLRYEVEGTNRNITMCEEYQYAQLMSYFYDNPCIRLS